MKPFFSLWPKKKHSYFVCISFVDIHGRNDQLQLNEQTLPLHVVATSMLQMHHYISNQTKFLFALLNCGNRQWPLQFSFFFFFCFYIFSLVKHIVIYLKSNRIKESTRFIIFAELRSYKNIYIIGMLIEPRVLLATYNLHKTNYKKKQVHGC